MRCLSSSTFLFCNEPNFLLCPFVPKKKGKKTKEALYYKSTTFDWLALTIEHSKCWNLNNLLHQSVPNFHVSRQGINCRHWWMGYNSQTRGMGGSSWGERLGPNKQQNGAIDDWSCAHLQKACEAATSSELSITLFVVFLLCFGKEVLIVPMETLWVIEPSLQAMTILGGQQLKYS